jgi:hypothetical protein
LPSEPIVLSSGTDFAMALANAMTFLACDAGGALKPRMAMFRSSIDLMVR